MDNVKLLFVALVIFVFFSSCNEEEPTTVPTLTIVNTTPVRNDNILFINRFSTDYMFGNATYSDGSMHRYKKLE